MSRPQKAYQSSQKEQIKQAFKTSTDAKEQKRLLCLKLRMELGLSSKQIAQILECSEIQVRSVISKYGRSGLESILKGKQGGNHRNLSFHEEDELLAPFLSEAKSGKILVVSDIHKAYETRLGRAAPLSTTYRLLDRHGWRKIKPRPKHPKSKPEEFEAYKKNSRKG
jgi:transposase